MASSVFGAPRAAALRVQRRSHRQAQRSSSLRVRASATPTIFYFGGDDGFRGRTEVFKLALASKDLGWKMAPLDKPALKGDRDAYPFAQCPRYVDDEVDLVQSNTICRHIARKHGLYGDGSLMQMALVDMWLDGVESIRAPYAMLIYVDKLDAEALAAYKTRHVDPATTEEKNYGAHFAYLDGLLRKNNGGDGFCVGTGLTIADLQLWEIVDIHLHIAGDELRANYPALIAHHERIAQLPGIKEYLAGPLRMAQINANGLGQPAEAAA
ncbi:unnamed protein product [Pedinophyceae sp. YPF-701]|nr:unnamed protein product [Pedinophyceae sp. YPF-701]